MFQCGKNSVITMKNKTVSWPWPPILWMCQYVPTSACECDSANKSVSHCEATAQRSVTLIQHYIWLRAPINCCKAFSNNTFVWSKLEFEGSNIELYTLPIYYAPPSSPKGARRCPDRGIVGGALVFLQELWLLYALGLYTRRKIHAAKLGSSNCKV